MQNYFKILNKQIIKVSKYYAKGKPEKKRKFSLNLAKKAKILYIFLFKNFTIFKCFGLFLTNPQLVSDLFQFLSPTNAIELACFYLFCLEKSN